jgi:hypothetical protein
LPAARFPAVDRQVRLDRARNRRNGSTLDSTNLVTPAQQWSRARNHEGSPADEPELGRKHPPAPLQLFHHRDGRIRAGMGVANRSEELTDHDEELTLSHITQMTIYPIEGGAEGAPRLIDERGAMGLVDGLPEDREILAEQVRGDRGAARWSSDRLRQQRD